jgi:hypothetical protein
MHPFGARLLKRRGDPDKRHSRHAVVRSPPPSPAARPPAPSPVVAHLVAAQKVEVKQLVATASRLSDIYMMHRMKAPVLDVLTKAQSMQATLHRGQPLNSEAVHALERRLDPYRALLSMPRFP